MKRNIYFAGSIRGGRTDADLYRRMIQLIKQTDNVLTEHIGDPSLSLRERGRKGDAEIYDQDTAWLRKSDLLIAECTNPSLGVGYELAYAENLGIPCCIFYDRSKTQLSAMLTGNSYFSTYPYASESELFTQLKKVLDQDREKIISVRNVRIGDEEILARIQTESWKAAFCDILDSQTLSRLTVPEKAAAMYKSLLDERTGFGYILEVSGVPFGMAWWDRTREKDMPGYAELICIHSLPENWRKGYGRKLMESVLTDISDSGYEKVMLWVFEKNSRARAFYESFGFQMNGKHKDFHGQIELCYELSLKQAPSAGPQR